MPPPITPDVVIVQKCLPAINERVDCALLPLMLVLGACLRLCFLSSVGFWVVELAPKELR